MTDRHVAGRLEAVAIIQSFVSNEGVGINSPESHRKIPRTRNR